MSGLIYFLFGKNPKPTKQMFFFPFIYYYFYSWLALASVHKKDRIT
jgi:hypothetical protein